MPKSGVKISAIAVIRIIIFIFIAFIIFSGYTRVREFVTSDNMFAIKNIMIESSIQFIDKAPLTALKGRNIFDVDIHRMQQDLSMQYPQITYLRVVREMPDTIKVLAKRRDMLFQVTLKNKFLLVDAQGLAVIYSSTPLNLVNVIGFPVKPVKKIILGQPVDGVLGQAVMIISKLRQTRGLEQVVPTTVDVSNPAKIVLTIKDIEARIILDSDHGPDKLDVLSMLLTQKKLDLMQVEYVDLRFEQPVIATKPEEKLLRKK